MKENNGHGARQQLWKKLLLVILSCLIIGAALVVLSNKERINYDVDGTGTTGIQVGGRRKSPFGKLFRRPRVPKLPNKAKAMKSTMQSSLSSSLAQNKKKEEYYERILAAELNLVDIDADKRILRESSSKGANLSYDGVYGSFCKVNWAAHKEDPSSVPMFRFVRAASPECEQTLVRVPLKEIASLARDMDQQNHRKSTDANVPKPLNFTAIVFHESRCGSTLVANILASMDPIRHRVYAESPPPITVMMNLCGENYEICTRDQAAAILQDVVYLMSRTNDPKEERLFIKMQSKATLGGIQVFRRAFPTTPWIFVYREPIQVMQSHLVFGTRYANCLRSMKHPPQTTQQLIQKHTGTSAADLKPEEYCAAYLATLTQTALENLKQQRSGGGSTTTQNYGIAVNYDSLPRSMYEAILPRILGVPTIGPKELDRILTISGTYSKGVVPGQQRGGRRHNQQQQQQREVQQQTKWKDDSAKKEEAASETIRRAAKKFMLESYEGLQELAVGGSTTTA